MKHWVMYDGLLTNTRARERCSVSQWMVGGHTDVMGGCMNTSTWTDLDRESQLNSGGKEFQSSQGGYYSFGRCHCATDADWTCPNRRGKAAMLLFVFWGAVLLLSGDG